MDRLIPIIMLSLPGIVGFIIRFCGFREIPAWLWSCIVIPSLIMIDEFLLPYHGGGASMWSIALAVGSFYGAMTGGLGVVIASYFVKRNKMKVQNP
jgi:hypothetical protein